MTTSTTKKIYVVDGSRFSTLAEAGAEFTQVFGFTMPWNGNFDDFNDLVTGGFGTPDDGFILIWRHSDISRQRLGYGETLLWLEERVQHCRACSVAHWQKKIDAARRQEGDTVFDTIVYFIRHHADIELRLE